MRPPGASARHRGARCGCDGASTQFQAAHPCKLGGRPLGHQSSRKAASLVCPRGRLFQKPRLHASEGLEVIMLKVAARVFSTKKHQSSMRILSRSRSPKQEMCLQAALRPLSVICEIFNRSQRILRGYHSAYVDSSRKFGGFARCVRPQPFCLRFCKRFQLASICRQNGSQSHSVRLGSLSCPGLKRCFWPCKCVSVAELGGSKSLISAF